MLDLFVHFQALSKFASCDAAWFIVTSLISCSISMSILAVDEFMLDIHMTSNVGPAPHPDQDTIGTVHFFTISCTIGCHHNVLMIS